MKEAPRGLDEEARKMLWSKKDIIKEREISFQNFKGRILNVMCFSLVQSFIMKSKDIRSRVGWVGLDHVTRVSLRCHSARLSASLT